MKLVCVLLIRCVSVIAIIEVKVRHIQLFSGCPLSSYLWHCQHLVCCFTPQSILLLLLFLLSHVFFLLACPKEVLSGHFLWRGSCYSRCHRSWAFCHHGLKLLLEVNCTLVLLDLFRGWRLVFWLLFFDFIHPRGVYLFDWCSLLFLLLFTSLFHPACIYFLRRWHGLFLLFLLIICVIKPTSVYFLGGRLCWL